MGHAILPAMC